MLSALETSNIETLEVESKTSVCTAMFRVSTYVVNALCIWQSRRPLELAEMITYLITNNGWLVVLVVA